MFRERRRRRTGPDDRRLALDAYLAELTVLDPGYLVSLAPMETGFWVVPELSARWAGVELGVRTLRLHRDDREVQFVVEVVPPNRWWYSPFADGFVVRHGRDIEPMSDDDWAVWNI